MLIDQSMLHDVKDCRNSLNIQVEHGKPTVLVDSMFDIKMA